MKDKLNTSVSISSVRVTDYGPRIDWEQRRYELAKSAMQANLSNPEILQFITKDGVPIERVAKCSIQYADALLKELKKGE